MTSLNEEVVVAKSIEDTEVARVHVLQNGRVRNLINILLSPQYDPHEAAVNHFTMVMSKGALLHRAYQRGGASPSGRA